MHYFLIALVLILVHQVFIVLILGLAAAIGAILGGDFIESILMFILGFGPITLVIGIITAMRRLGVEKDTLERALLPPIFASMILMLPVVPFIARGAVLGSLGDRAVPVAGLVGSHRDGWVRLTDGALDMGAARYGCVTHGKGT